MSGRIPHALLAHGSELWLAALAAAMAGVMAAAMAGGGTAAAVAGVDQGHGTSPGRWSLRAAVRLPLEGTRSLAVGKGRVPAGEGGGTSWFMPGGGSLGCICAQGAGRMHMLSSRLRWPW